VSGFVSFEHDARSTAAADKGRGGHGRPVPGERIATPTQAPTQRTAARRPAAAPPLSGPGPPARRMHRRAGRPPAAV
jgi:hypothetical protein